MDNFKEDEYAVKEPKILIWDIETSLMEYMGFSIWNQNIPISAIKRDWNIICVCYKLLGKKGVKSVSVLDDPDRFAKDIHDDYHVVKTMWEILQGVDILVHHYGDVFDLKKFNSRVIYHGLPPLKTLLTVDTKKEISKVAKFSSGKLDWLGMQLIGDHKDKTDYQLWIDCQAGDVKAIKYMTKYCKKDVSLLEDVYIKLRPYFKGHPNVAEVGTHNCPKCNSANTIKHKNRLMASGIQKYQRQCNNCGSYFTLKGTVGSPISRM